MDSNYKTSKMSGGRRHNRLPLLCGVICCGILSMMPSSRNFFLAASSFLVVSSWTSTSPTAVEGAMTVYQDYRNLCRGRPVISKKHDKAVQWLIKNVGESNVVASTTPQHEAACWMLREMDKHPFSAQRFVMAVIYYGTKGAKWNINTGWMTHKHECTWYGVKCNMFKKVVGLDLGYIEVNGLVPREIGLLTDLKDLDLHGNDLQGVIPHKLLVGLKKLEYLRLHMNGMFGAIHKEITNMKYLKELHIFGNYIAGTIPKQLSELKKLGKLTCSFFVLVC